ncbi:MAG TPA: tRNA (adenosine(37)-N6)-threonylcarbamoyltransferase complex dimerization subunit type 1 TsaB [Bacillota bacterium]|nr:tRNA (adenosine(37)-N6)-threonylcarbamoyltransferase complex dimerization subunit type 1 TsaB [Bacillota bacterium]
MYILAIDTSTHTLGVAIMKDSRVIGEIVTHLKKNHSVRLMPAIDQLMKEVKVIPEDLTKIVVAKGPGSYTGVRIGLTTAKTMAWALDIPIIGVSSLEVLAYQGRFYNSLICPFFDARRGMVFTGLYQWDDQQMIPVVDEQNLLMNDWLQFLAKKNQEILFLSPHMEPYYEMIKEYLGNDCLIPEETYHISKPSHLALAGKKKEADHPYTLTPNYLRLAEAEANWLKLQKEQRNGSFKH